MKDMENAHPERLTHRHDGELAHDGHLGRGLARCREYPSNINAPHFDVQRCIGCNNMTPACIHCERHLVNKQDNAL